MQRIIRKSGHRTGIQQVTRGPCEKVGSPSSDWQPGCPPGPCLLICWNIGVQLIMGQSCSWARAPVHNAQEEKPGVTCKLSLPQSMHDRPSIVQQPPGRCDWGPKIGQDELGPAVSDRPANLHNAHWDETAPRWFGIHCIYIATLLSIDIL